MKRPEEIPGPTHRRFLHGRSRVNRKQAVPARDSDSRPEFRQLQQLARMFGIQPFYADMTGRHRQASADTLKAMLRLWQVPVENPRAVTDSWRDAHRQVR